MKTKDVEKFKTHILCSITFFESHAVYEKISEKYFTAKEVTNNMALAHCMLDT
jgi:hypothetical protein